ncbi:MAG: GDSL-type esterase/lipase family protein [Opitutaceae bacterium]|jgi:beta-glucosidase|nr:GDSL-type esterase/lipase family protein [Opitutaceae bacterium]
MRKKIASVLLGLALLASACATTVPAPVAATPQMKVGQDGQPARYSLRRAEMLKKRAQKGGYDVLFLGDSITHQWEWVCGAQNEGRERFDKTGGKAVWDAKIAPLGAEPSGIGGDRTEHLLWRIEDGLLGGKADPKVVVLMIGTNNTGHRMDSPADIAAGVGAIVRAVQKRKPATKILVLGIFPRGEKSDDPKRVNNTQANALIARLADGKNVFYKDIGGAFVAKDGSLERVVMPDFLHLNTEGFNRWADAIIPDIKQLLGK